MDSEVPVVQKSQLTKLRKLKRVLVVALVVVAAPWWFGVLTALFDLGRGEPEYKYYGEPPPEGYERDLQRRGLRMNIVAGCDAPSFTMRYADAYNWTQQLAAKRRDAP